MDTSQWYYTRGGAQQGPVTFDELRKLAETGQFGPGDLVWQQGMAQWQPAHQATPFFGAAPPPAAPQGAYPPGYLPPDSSIETVPEMRPPRSTSISP